MKTLVVYFSRKGYVKRVAGEAAAAVGGDLLELRTPERTKGFLGFWWCGRFGMHRWPMKIEHEPVDVGGYDKVIICSPVWVLSVSAPVRAFLEEVSGKVRSVDYILVHFSNPMRYTATRKEMDELLGIKHDRFTSMVCCWGKVLRRREYTNG